MRPRPSLPPGTPAIDQTRAPAPRQICPLCSVKGRPTYLAAPELVCPNCGHHYRLTAAQRIELTFDDGRLRESGRGVVPSDPLRFPNYEAKLAQARDATGLSAGVVTGFAAIGGTPVVAGVMDFRFMGGSMGGAEGERIVRAILTGARKRRPVVLFTASGGARMQEGVFSLIQMANTAAAVSRLRKARCPFITVMTDPTTGGVAASFAMLGDLIIAEPAALIAFAGSRVVERVITEEHPQGYRLAEYHLANGFVDMIVDRRELRDVLSKILRMHRRGR